MRINEVLKKMEHGGKWDIDIVEGTYKKLSDGTNKWGLYEVGLLKDGEDALQFFLPQYKIGSIKDGNYLVCHNVLAYQEEYEGKLQNKLKFSKDSRIESGSGFKPKEPEREEVHEERIELSKEEKEKIVLDDVSKTYAQSIDISVNVINKAEPQIKELIVKGLIMPLGFNEIVNSIFIQLSRAKFFGMKKGAEY